MVWRSLILFRKQTPRSRFGQLLLKQTIAPQLQISKKQGGREIKRYWQCSQTVKLQKECNSPTEFIAEILCKGLQLSRGVISVSTGHLRGELRMSMIKLKQYQHPARKFWRQTAFSNEKRTCTSESALWILQKKQRGIKENLLLTVGFYVHP